MKMVDEESKNDVVKEAREMLASGALILPLRVEGWHMSLSSGGWHIKNASDRIVMTVAFVPVELETGKPALEGNAPARHTAALLNSVPALCDELEELRRETLKGMCSYCGLIQHYETLEQKDGDEGKQIRIEHIKQCPQRPELKLIAEVERLMALNNTQAESITHLQNEVRELNDQIAKTSWQVD